MTQGINLLLWFQMTSSWHSQMERGCDLTPHFKPFWLTATNLSKLDVFLFCFFNCMIAQVKRREIYFPRT